jgi:hypothetical protein
VTEQHDMIGSLRSRFSRSPLLFPPSHLGLTCKVARTQTNAACALIAELGFNKWHPPDYNPEEHGSLNAYRGASTTPLLAMLA